ncbi:MAG: hypothetical protein ACK4HE_08640 [Chitinophagaceae bacterium]
MKTLQHILYLCSLSMLWLLQSCTKEVSEEFVAYNNSTNDTVWLAAGNGSADMSVTIPIDTMFKRTQIITDSARLNTSDIMRFNNQVKLLVRPNSVFTNQGPYYGTLMVDLNITSTKGDHIRNNRFNNVGDLPIEAVSIFSLRGYAPNNVALFVNNNSRFDLIHKLPQPQSGLKLYYAESASNNWGGNAWVPSTDTNAVVPTPILGTTITDTGYNVAFKRLGTIMIGKPIDTTQQHSRVNLILPPNYTNANTAAYVIYQQQKVVLRMLPDVTNKLFYVNAVPNNTPIYVLVISMRGNQLYMTGTQTLANPTQIHRLTPQPVSRQQVEQLLDNL